MKCKYCGAEVPKESQFCPNCGKDLSKLRKCVKCGEIIDDDATFCPHCGAEQPVYDEDTPRRRWLIPVIVITILFILGVGGYYLWSNGIFDSQKSNNAIASKDTTTAIANTDSVSQDKEALSEEDCKAMIKKIIPQIMKWVSNGYTQDVFRPRQAESLLSPNKFILTKSKHTWGMEIEYFDEEENGFDNKYTNVTSEDYVYTLNAKYTPNNRVYDQSWASEVFPTGKYYLAVAFAWSGNSFFINSTIADAAGAQIDLAYPKSLSKFVKDYLKELGYRKDTEASQDGQEWFSRKSDNPDEYSAMVTPFHAGNTEGLRFQIVGNG